MNERECGTCEFWLKRSDSAARMGGGYCVRFPPFAPSQWTVSSSFRFGSLHVVNPDSEHLNDAWPMTSQQSWCGEWRDRPISDLGISAIEAERANNG